MVAYGKHKKLTLNYWIENMRNPFTHADDIALYQLCRMYNKHTYVHISRYSWNTLPLKIDNPPSVVLPKCDIELVLLDCWLF